MAPKKMNGFALFMIEHREALRKSGRNITMAEAQSVCDPIWKNMGKAQQDEYKVRAKTDKRTQQVTRYTSLGQSIDAVEQQQQDEAHRLQNLKKDIITKIGNTPINNLANLPFQLVDCQIFCNTSGGLYIPAEITLGNFTLKQGKLSTLHQLINPEEIPRGYMSAAQQSVAGVHRIPVPINRSYADELESAFEKKFVTMDTAYENILEWIKSNKPWVLFAPDEKVDIVKGVLRTLAQSEETIIPVGPASWLLYYLHKHVCEVESDGFPNTQAALDEINRDTYFMCESLACFFHRSSDERMDKIRNCTMSVVQRYAFYINDLCCEPLGVKLVKGIHYPVDN